MRRLSFLFVVVFIPLITPVLPLFGGHAIFAQGTTQTTDYVDKDFPEAMDKAKQEDLRDMNAVGHVASVNTTMYGDLIRRTFGPIKGITTNSTDTMYLNQMYKDSLAYGASVALVQIYTNPPASTYAFVKDVGQSLGFIPKSVHAQGIGFSGLSPLLPLWKAFRNIAYLLLALFMIVIGFLIMFRKKIDPKTVVTVQNALPNIVVTLLLITFSYAIVGLLIDFMYLIIMISVSILREASGGAIDQSAAADFVSGNFWTVFKYLIAGGWEAALNGIVPMLGPFAIGTEATTMGIGLLVSLFSSLPGLAVGTVLPPLLLLAIIALAFIIAIVRLFFLLISSYIQIILSLLISPFQLLIGAFPGSHAFEGWIKNLIANISVFPITAIMLLIGTILVKFETNGTKLWGPPMLNPAGNSGMAGVIGLGVLFAIPSVAGSLKEALKAKPMVQAGPSAVIGPIGGAVQQGWSVAYQLSMIKGLIPHGKEPTPQKPE